MQEPVGARLHRALVAVSADVCERRVEILHSQRCAAQRRLHACQRIFGNDSEQAALVHRRFVVLTAEHHAATTEASILKVLSNYASSAESVGNILQGFSEVARRFDGARIRQSSQSSVAQTFIDVAADIAVQPVAHAEAGEEIAQLLSGHPVDRALRVAAVLRASEAEEATEEAGVSVGAAIGVAMLASSSTPASRPHVVAPPGPRRIRPSSRSAAAEETGVSAIALADGLSRERSRSRDLRS